MSRSSKGSFDGGMMEVIQNRKWLVKRSPYKHAIVTDLLEKQQLALLTENFRRRISSNAAASKVNNYDANIVPLKSVDRGAFAPFLDVEWLQLIARAMGLRATLEIDGALHSHPPGSRSGWVHNDYNPGWFGRAATPDGMYLNDDECNYRTGKVRFDEVRPIRRMRYLTFIFYLDNPVWQPGMGGETGIYFSESQSVDRADVFVPPLNNTMLLFECGPHSWHAFRTTSFQRNSIILWLHRDFDEARQQWPHHDPVNWT